MEKKIIIVAGSLLAVAGIVLGGVAIARNNKIEEYKQNKEEFYYEFYIHSPHRLLRY